MKKLNNKNRFWFYAIKTIRANGGQKEKSIIANTNDIKMVYSNSDAIVEVSNCGEKCYVYIPAFDIAQCAIVG